MKEVNCSTIHRVFATNKRQELCKKVFVYQVIQCQKTHLHDRKASADLILLKIMKIITETI